ncbi:Cytochrome c-type biogenesis protein CcmH [Magnetospirillum sp. LM-5]|uniref:cytochrome c-type biogenesis protein n=1 Tax=Magnetospirillum sp. LM-5 TaxID=2681466 RepID=UPI00137D09DA|nr:cytochrome c-type biogenesis protein [Magnetospirillum sp. LM-5]CAA7621512.1 Cytochrome c-type biogenesis protein CcmH [Magnetospirillum sp. LM-5]
MIRLAVLLSVLWLAQPAFAADPSEMLKDPALEKRAHTLGKELRCLVCQSESIEDSNADLAKDLRIIVREQIGKGASDEQVKKFVVDRYGDYVLLNPPFKGATLVLWLGPFGLLAVSLVAAWAFFRRRAKGQAPAGSAPLSDAEKRRLEALLKDGK